MFRILDTEQLQHCLSAWVEHLQFCLEGQTVAIDGKTLRGSHNNAGSVKPLHVVNVWANSVNFCLGQISVTKKSNEIPAVQELLSILNLKGAVVTADAMHCQQKTATKIIDSDADYILQVKNNQPRLLKTIAKSFADHEATDFAAKQVRSSTIRERNRTREETRIGMVCPAPAPAPVALRCVAKAVDGFKNHRADGPHSSSEQRYNSNRNVLLHRQPAATRATSRESPS